jgi:phenylpropionate dioxygenase-like ring-hydroxylating dioxygenase large terminal subunit
MATMEKPTSFTTLPRAFYMDDEALFEAEIARLWSQEWLYLAHTSEIPEPGDYIIRRILNESVIVTRTQDGDVVALLNVCRHRGARILDAPCGNAKRFVCPYHQWTYELDGELKAAPSMPENEIDYDSLGMYRLSVDTWRGLIFGCFSQDPPPSIATEIEKRSPFLAPYEPERMRKVGLTTFDCEANWKVMLENYLECYHCSGSHPEFCRTADLQIRGEDDYSASAYSEEPYWALDIPLRAGAQTASMSGDRLCRVPLGGEADFESRIGVSRGFVIQPAFTVLYFYADYAMVHEVRPISPQRVQFHVHWFVQEDATDEDFDFDELSHVWKMTTKQDVELIERTQDGLSSRRYSPGPLSAKQEPGIHAALNTYLGIMAGDPRATELLDARCAEKT